MARTNCDPYAGFHLFALVNRVTGLLEREDEVNAAVRALEESGVETDDINIFTGDQGAKCLDLAGKEHGRAVRLLRTLEHALGHEGESNHRIDDALHKGATLICVKIHKPRTDEKGRAVRALQAHHAHDIHFWGPWGSQDMPEGSGACALCTLAGERILGENEHAVWIRDAHPVSPGHSLIISKRHIESFFDTPAPERVAILSMIDQARESLNRDHAPSGYNIGINEGAAAGQMVSHLHIHLIPRFDGDRKNPRGGVRWVLPDKADFWSPR